MVKGGTKSNVIPGFCELTVDARWIPKHGSAFVERGPNFDRRVPARREDADAPTRGSSCSTRRYSLKIPKGHPAVKLAESLTGFKSGDRPVWTEAALYTKARHPIHSPGAPAAWSMAHVIDEFVEVGESEEGALQSTRR